MTERIRPPPVSQPPSMAVRLLVMVLPVSASAVRLVAGARRG
ncbi:hypothetical protein [Actinomadura sp. 9N215]